MQKFVSKAGLAVPVLTRCGLRNRMFRTAGLVPGRLCKASFQHLFQHHASVSRSSTSWCRLTQWKLPVDSGSRGYWLRCISRSTGLLGTSNLWVRHMPSCGFHASQKLQIHPVFWIFLKPMAKLGAILSGRGVRKWWQTLPDKKRDYFWSRLRQNWHWVAAVNAALFGSVLVYYKTHLQKAPITGRERFVVVTNDQYLKIAEEEAKNYLQLYEDNMLPPNHLLVKRVVHIGKRLLDANPEIKGLMNFKGWKVFVINDPQTVNAFVLPTGHIFVFAGIIHFAENDDQLAMVLAHEMSHALLSHGIETVSYTQLLDFVIIAAMAAIWCILPTDGLAFITQWFYDKIIAIMLHMPYSRQLEREADKVGLQLAARACYDVREGSVFWARMALKEEITDTEEKIPEWLSTHPSHQKRVEYINFLLPQAEELREESKCPKLSARDPREAIKILSDMVEQEVIARRTGQNLTRVRAPGVAIP